MINIKNSKYIFSQFAICGLAWCLFCVQANAADVRSTPVAVKAQAGGLTFQLRDIEIADVLLPDSPSPTDPGQKEGSAKKGFLALTFQIINDGPPRPITALSQLPVALSTLAGEKIPLISMDPPVITPRETSGNEPEFLPSGGIYTRVLYFTSPVFPKQDYFFEIDLRNIQIPSEIILKFPADKVCQVPDITQKREPREADVLVIAPLNQSEAKRGQLVAVKIKISEFVEKPQSIFILLPSETFEDKFVNLQYNVRIPADATWGEYPITVMAVWRSSAGERTISRTVNLKIIESALSLSETAAPASTR